MRHLSIIEVDSGWLFAQTIVVVEEHQGGGGNCEPHVIATGEPVAEDVDAVAMSGTANDELGDVVHRRHVVDQSPWTRHTEVQRQSTVGAIRLREEEEGRLDVYMAADELDHLGHTISPGFDDLV